MRQGRGCLGVGQKQLLLLCLRHSIGSIVLLQGTIVALVFSQIKTVFSALRSLVLPRGLIQLSKHRLPNL